MGEIKSVKVDNWGVFFLQKLQNFFNKTDYCDLTLQFNDNSQLKVHRLVLSACTDYFNVLEQTCEMIEDVLIMPLELQADVVVPIVNFMYTGTLEFELRMYGRLLKTARDMNMTVLLKLLEAHRRTMEKSPTINRPAKRNQPETFPKRPVGRPATNKTYHTTQQQQQQQRRIQTNNLKSLQIKPITGYFPSTSGVQNVPKAKLVKGPSRFDYANEGGESLLPPDSFEQSFDTISYESKPLTCKEEPDSGDYDAIEHKDETSIQFEELRRGYSNNKRPSSVSSFESPPEKKPNIEDVKEYAEQQRMRKQIAQEYDDDNEYDETIIDDEYNRDDDDEDYVPTTSYKKAQQKQPKQITTGNQSQRSSPTIIIKHENNEPTFIVKDASVSKTDHAKIISEVLKKYPHIVKGNKNIRLKIMPTSNEKTETQKIPIKKDQIIVPHLPPPGIKRNTYPSASQRSSTTVSKISTPMQVREATINTTGQPRRIDSKTMHSLIAMGAENRTGPWLCLKCGVNGRPISIPSYRGFRRHLINSHKEKIDPRLCEHCGWRSTNNQELFFHMFIEHKVKPPPSYDFPRCELCSSIFIGYCELEKHIAENHEDGVEVNQNCIYCNHVFANENLLYSHMRLQHKEQAKEDGIMEFSDDDDDEVYETPSQYSSGSSKKINILSDISLPKNIPVIQAEDNTPGTTITLPPDVLDTNSSQGPKFVNEDGKEMDLTEEQRQQIMAQLDEQGNGNVVMVLNESIIEEANEEKPADPLKVEKEAHKPRKTKHTVRKDIDEGDYNDQLIEWLDEESGNIVKIPISKLDKLTEISNEEKDEANTGETERENSDEKKEPKKEDSKSAESESEAEKEFNGSADETTSDSTKVIKEEIIEDKPIDENSFKENKNDIKNKEKAGAMETLKILSGEWTDEEDVIKEENVDDHISSSEEQQSQENLSQTQKAAEIIFATYATPKPSEITNDEKSKSISESVFEPDDMLKTSDDDHKLDDVMDDDMKIIEELKNYEEEQLAVAAMAEKEKHENNKEQKQQEMLRERSKLSPSFSEGSSRSGSSGASSNRNNMEKMKKRGRPKKHKSEEKEKTPEKERQDEVFIEERDEGDAEKSKESIEEDDSIEIKKIETIIPDSVSQDENNDDDDDDNSDHHMVSEDLSEITDEHLLGQDLLADETSKCSDRSDDKESKKSNKSELSMEQQPKLSETDGDGLMSKADIRNLINDWGDEDDDDL